MGKLSTPLILFDGDCGFCTTVVLVEGGRHDVKSSAALRIVRRMRGLWPILFVFVLIPVPIRDFIYNFIARNHYRWFGKRESCLAPAADVRERFLE